MAMANICYKPEPRAEIWRIVPRVLMSALQSDCEFRRCYCVAALGNLAAQNGFYQEQIREEGGIPLLIGLLREDQAKGMNNSVSECTQLHVVTAIANLTHNNDLNQKE